MRGDPLFGPQRMAAFAAAMTQAYDLSQQVAERCGPRITVAAFIGAAVVVARSGGISRDDFAALMAGALSDGWRDRQPDPGAERRQ